MHHNITFLLYIRMILYVREDLVDVEYCNLKEAVYDAAS